MLLACMHGDSFEDNNCSIEYVSGFKERIVTLRKENAKFFQSIFNFSFIFGAISHINSETNPCPTL